MLRVDPTLNHIPARREHVVSLYESINQPLVNIPNHGTAATGAYLLGTRNEHGYYTVFVYLHQPDTRAVIIYVSEPRNLTADQFRVEEAEAVRFVESMGFMVDSVHFRQLSGADQEAVMGRVPIFRPPQQTVDLYEVAPEEAPPPDPIFGGIAASTADLFRRAGLGGPTPGSAAQAGFQPQPSGLPGMGPPPANVLGTGMSTPPFAAPPGSQPPMGGLTPSSWGPGGALSTTPAKPAFQPQPSLSNSGLVIGGFPASQRPAEPVPVDAVRRPDPRESNEALQRLGRLLAAFGILLALQLAPACKGGGAQDTPANDKLDTQIDLGQQHLAEGKFAEAISVFQLVLNDAPDEKTALRGTALAYNALNRKEEAERLYRRLMELEPKWSEPKNDLAGILLGSRRCEEAERLLREVKGDIFYASPEYADNNLALALECLGRAGEGIKLLEESLNQRPLFCRGYLTLSQISSQNKQPEVTVRACEGFIRHCAENEHLKDQIGPELRGLCYLRSGLAYAEMGDVESARSSFMRCQSVNGSVGKECQRSLELLPR